MTLAETLRRHGIKYQTYYSRITIMGWSKRAAMTVPPSKPGAYGKYRPNPRRCQ